MKKKQIANLIMAAIIVVIVAAGLLCVGMVQGWFDQADGSRAVLTNIRGIVNIQRDGVSYSAGEDTVLRAGDKIACSSGATAMIQTADGYLTLANSAQIEITDPASDSFTAKVSAGEVFANTVTPATLIFDGQEVELTDTVALLSVRSGAQSISVFAGSVEDVQSGQVLNWVGGEKNVGVLAIQSLNDFAITQLRAANGEMTLCFTNDELDQLEADRWAEKQAQLMDTQPTVPDSTNPSTEPATETTVPVTEVTDPPTETTQPTTTEPAETTQPSTTTPPETTAPPATDPPATDPPATEPVTTDPPATDPPATDPPATDPPVTEPPVTEPPVTEPPTPSYDGYCTITIRCDTILDNWDNLDPAKAEFVPSSGVILPTVTVGFNDGETVFDVLNRVCTAYGIQIEYSWTPMYNSYYIEGINHLYEFDCGSESGWMYKVNGWFPNYGCSSYDLVDGDVIVWCYTCVGLGSDVGDVWMGE